MGAEVRHERRVVAAAVAFALTGAGCATPSPPVVEAVGREYRATEDERRVADNAPMQLYEAKQAVKRLRGADPDDAAEVEHLARLARIRIDIARRAGAALAAEQSLTQLGDERDRMLIRARTVEARQLEAEADQAMRRARLLEEQLSELRAEETVRGVVLTLREVLFEVDRARVLPGAEVALGEVAAFLNEFPERRIAVEGHTDDTGDGAYNQRLSEQRASAVAEFLVAHGVERQRMRVLGYGESRPVAPNRTASGRQQNRRVEIVLDRR